MIAAEEAEFGLSRQSRGPCYGLLSLSLKNPLKVFQASVSLDPLCDGSGKRGLEVRVLALALTADGGGKAWRLGCDW